MWTVNNNLYFAAQQGRLENYKEKPGEKTPLWGEKLHRHQYPFKGLESVHKLSWADYAPFP